jgi:hypothetical protein
MVYKLYYYYCYYYFAYIANANQGRGSVKYFRLEKGSTNQKV